MQVSSTNSPSFTSVIPTRVIIDGKEAVTKEFMQAGCKKLIEILAGPIKNNEKAQNIARQVAVIDRDYDYSRAVNGYTCHVYEYGKHVKKTASNFFRYMNINGRDFLITGPQAERLSKTGQQLGRAKAMAKAKGLKENVETIEIYQAKRTYSELINKLANNKALRVREGYDSSSKINKGNETVLNIYLSSNRKYGKSTFKMDVDKVEFKPYTK